MQPVQENSASKQVSKFIYNCNLKTDLQSYTNVKQSNQFNNAKYNENQIPKI